MTLVALGDSVTWGVGDDDGPQRGWAAHLAHALGVPAFHNLAMVGARTGDLVGGQLPRALDLGPTLTTIQIGGNDVLRQGFDPRVIARAVATCCRVLPGIRVVVLLPDPRRLLPRPRLVARALAGRAASLNLMVAAAVRHQPEVILVEPWNHACMHAPEQWHVDRLHPSPLGHRLLAAHSLARLTELGLRQQQPIEPPLNLASSVADAWWLLRAGVPWLAKRSVDLFPELLRVCYQEAQLGRVPQDPTAPPQVSSVVTRASQPSAMANLRRGDAIRVGSGRGGGGSGVLAVEPVQRTPVGGVPRGM